MSVECINRKAKPIRFRAKSKILSKNRISVFNMDNKNVQSTQTATIIHGWYIDTHMRIYYENDNKEVFRTTSIDAIDGTIVTTKSGSVYQLGNMDKLIQTKLNGLDIDINAPLHLENIPFLVNASYDIYKK